ncbi:anthranilate synthase component I family protein [Candidatus Gracilibacteria bacterium]|nr:anthranilate synthase component I family protein [Candidatus Gracilibacteria bacterium]NUJ98950.1 anthranilate synthase component I family protein [Candidatus Gracilibacteria bacterium]
MNIELLPEIQNIKKYKKKGNFLPVYTEISSGIGTPINCLENLISENVNYPFLFESLDSASNTSRYTIIGFNPRKTFLFQDEKTCLVKDYKFDKEEKIIYKNPFDILKEETKKFKSIKNDNLPPLTSGLIGYMGYDNIESLYKISKHKNIDQNYPYGFFGLYKDFVIFDNFKQGKIQIISNIFLNDNINQIEFESKRKKVEINIRNILKIISKHSKNTPLILSGNKKNVEMNIKSNLSDTQYRNILNELKRDLTDGDVFQTVISETYSFDLGNISKSKNISGIDVYKGLRHINPASYMFYFNFKDFELIGSVPETFVRINGSKVLTRPLAGTRGVGKTLQDFKRLKHELQNNPKEKAEHTMLIDLIRNDLSKNCEPGSIKVTKKMYIKKYNHLIHIVSNVVGKIAKGKDYFDIFSGIFPHGNVTGAPKIKAMKLISKYEITNRGIYSGAIGYFGFNGNADFAVIIRTIIKKGNILYNQVGSGIVIDFVAEDEIKEHKNKNKSFIEILNLLYYNYHLENDEF